MPRENEGKNTGLIFGSIGAAALIFLLVKQKAFGIGEGGVVKPKEPPTPKEGDPIPIITFAPDISFNPGYPIQVYGDESYAVEGATIPANGYKFEFFYGKARLEIVNNKTAVFTPLNAGYYTIRLTITDSNGNSAATQETIEIVTLSLGSIVKGIQADERWKSASQEQINSLVAAIETPLRAGDYRGDGRYLINLSGEILPEKSPIYSEEGLLTGLSNFLKNDGIFIDYTDYPMYYLGSRPLWGLVGSELNWNFLMDILGINELGSEFLGQGHIEQKSTFFIPSGAQFKYTRSLVVLENYPPDNEFITCNEISLIDSSLVNFKDKNLVPFDLLNNIYSMFALKIGRGIYFYSNRSNSFNDYADFILTVHNKA